jgi:hypothetical protein
MTNLNVRWNFNLRLRLYNCRLSNLIFIKTRKCWVEIELSKCKHNRGWGLLLGRQSFLQSIINKNSRDVSYCKIQNEEIMGGSVEGNYLPILGKYPLQTKIPSHLLVHFIAFHQLLANYSYNSCNYILANY